MFHAEPPAPIYLYGWPATQAIDAIHRAIADVMPEAVSAGSGGDYCGVVWWGRRASGEFWAGGTDHVTGQGATHDGDGGAPLMHISFSGMRNTPVETLELRYPLLVEQFELAQDSAGAGRFRGGPGVDIRYRMLEDGQFTSPIERTRTRPWGLRGGEPGRPNGVARDSPGRLGAVALEDDCLSAFPRVASSSSRSEAAGATALSPTGTRKRCWRTSRTGSSPRKPRRATTRACSPATRVELRSRGDRVTA